MCGIAGMLWRGASEVGPAATLEAMGTAIAHRGPDAGTIWTDTGAGVGFAHRRLAVLDLTPAGAQPMHSASGRFVICFNGELYNHLELRAELEAVGAAPGWRGHSDTETLLAAIEHWGIESAVTRVVGMFAFAVWDRSLRRLSLARDRLGEKPLYYGWIGEKARRAFVFGSELKALRKHPAFDRPVDRRAVATFLRFGYVPAPHSIYEGIAKLGAGQILTLDHHEEAPTLATYWSGVEAVRRGRSAPFQGSELEATDQFEKLLRTSIKGQMLSDVPLGAFLSGGVDSSLIASLMQAESSTPAKTFTIGFHEAEFNEAPFAKEVARHLGTDHTELYVSPGHVLDIIPRLPGMFDEPFADSSQIPTFLVSELARAHVTVSLSGDAGDELFGGYNRYAFAQRLWSRIGWLPAPLRGAISAALRALSPTQWDRLGRPLQAMLPPSRRLSSFGDKLHKGAGVLGVASMDDLYHHLVSHWRAPGDVVVRGLEYPTAVSSPPDGLVDCSPTERMMALDMITYLPDDILAKVDRAAMAVSLETRVPLLDHRVVEFAWSLPESVKLRGRETKWLMRQVLYRHVPRQLIERPKVGFGVPLADWLRGALRDWAETLLDENRLRREGYFNPAPIREKWAEHLSGHRNWSYHLWDILMFQAWLEAQ